MRTFPIVIGLAAVLVGGPAAVHAAPKKSAKPPVARKVPVSDTYHGVAVSEDYRWLENSGDAEVKAWTGAQASYADAQLNALPATRPLLARLLELDAARVTGYAAFPVRDAWFAFRFTPSKNQPALVQLASPDDPAGARDVFDVEAIDPSGFTSVDFGAISPDGKKYAVSLSKKGSEEGTLYVYDLTTGKPLADVIPRVQYGGGGGSVVWAEDGKGFFYTRYPHPGERPDAELYFYSQIYFHALGTAVEKDTYVLGKDFPKIAEVELSSSRDGHWTFAAVLNGDGGERAYFLRSAKGTWTQVSRFEDQVVDAFAAADGNFYLLSRHGAPRGQLLRVPLAAPRLADAKVVVPESDASITGFTVTRSRLYITAMLGGPSELRRYALDGTGLTVVPTPPVSTVSQPVAVSPDGDDVLVRVVSYLEPVSTYRYSAESGLQATKLTPPPALDFSAYEVERVMVKSKDGSQVPLNIVHKKGLVRSGKNPTILTGYGGYGISSTPGFSPLLLAWLEQGGVWAQANLRGGAEFGETWHKEGKLTRKQNVFDDFIACAEWLIAQKVTSRQRLAIEGGSNGGLLMGAALTQRPDLFRAVLSWVGIYDMLRVELSTNGEYNITEFGTVKDKAQFDALLGYSPYHHVKDGTKYPSVLLLTGENDPRVEPMQSRKFAARLLGAGARDVLLFTNPDAGHGIPNRDQRFRTRAYSWAFLMDRLGMKYRPVVVTKAAR
jgi:prolyl oligopeptidase